MGKGMRRRQNDMFPRRGQMENYKSRLEERNGIPAQLIGKLVIPGIKMFNENRITVYSGYSTLFIVIALIPFIALIISVVNLIPGYSATDVADILLKILPDMEPIRALVVALISEMKAQSGGLLLASVAAVTTLWSASKGVMAIQKGLNELDNRAEDSETDGGTDHELIDKGVAYVIRSAKRLILTLMLIILIPAIMVLEMMGDSDAGRIGSLLIILPELLVVLLFFAKLPEVRRTFRSQLPGALITVLCWIVFTRLFSFFISRSYHYSNLYGSLAAVFLLLLWIRYMVMILFGGGVVNRVLESGENENVTKDVISDHE